MALLLHCFCLNGTWKTYITALRKSHAGAFFEEILGFLGFHFIPRDTEPDTPVTETQTSGFPLQLEDKTTLNLPVL